MSPNRHPWSWPLYFLSQLIYLIGLSTNRHSFLPRWSFFLAFTTICIYLIEFTTFRSAVDNFSIGSYLVTVCFDVMDFLVLRDVQREITIEGEKLGKIETESFVKRLKWAAKLIVSQRGIGWIDPLAPKVPHIPPPPTKGRRALVLAKLRELAFNVIMFDLVGILNRANPYFRRQGPSPAGEDVSALWRLAFVFGFAAGEYLILTTLHSVYCVCSVGFGLSEPRHWISLFGSVSEAYTLRSFWGRTWHQCMRRFLTSHSNFLIKKLQLSPQNPLALSIKFVVSFFISAFIHAAGDAMVFHNWTDGGSLAFFMLQPLGIVFETGIINLFRKMGVGIHWRIGRAVGFIWVLLWFSYTLPIFLGPLIRAGLFESGPSFSLILGISQGKWVPKN